MKLLALASLVTALSTSAFAAEPASGQKTCGQMVAEKAVLPKQMAVLMNAVAGSLDAHVKWMTAQNTKESKLEAKELTKLAKDHRAAAATFTKMAGNMEKLANL